MFLTPPEIQHQTLKSGRGYDRESVDQLLEQVASSYEQVWLERDQLRARLGELEGEVSNFREAERYLSETLVTAQRAAADLRSEAERDAERLKTEALVDLNRARTEAERELEDLRAEIEQFRGLERKLRANLRSFLDRAMRQLGDDDTIQEPGSLVDVLRPEAADVERRNA